MLGYSASAELVAVARLARKHTASLSSCSYAKARRPAAARRVPISRGNPLPGLAAPDSSAERANCSGELRPFWVACLTLASLVSNTGSARTASDFAGGFRPAVSLRSAANVEADGRLTTS